MNETINCINHTCQGERKISPVIGECNDCKTSSFLYDNQYRVLEKIGNMKQSHPWEVFMGEETTESDVGFKKVLIKTLIKDNPKNRVRFSNEINILCHLQHVGIPKFLAESIMPFGEKRPAIHFLVMEYIKGENLEEWLKKDGKLLNEEFAWRWLREITYILDHVHNRGFIHLDLNLSNIMLREEDRDDKTLVLIDFGVSKEIFDNKGASTDVGTRGYRAPETYIGKGDRRSDFYSLGRTFYHLTTGIRPIDGQIREDWGRDTNFPNSPIIDFINWMMKEKPDERPKTTGQILHAIDILSKPNQTRNNAKKLIKKISNPTQEDEEFRSQIQKNFYRIQQLTNSSRATSDQLTTTINILNRLIRQYNAIARRFNRLRKITIRAFVGVIFALVIGGLISKYFLYDQLYVANETQLSTVIDNLELQKSNLKLELEDTKSQLDNTKKTGDFISSGEKFMHIFGEMKRIDGKYKKIRQDAIEDFVSGDNASPNKRADYYKKAFYGFKKFYDHFGKSSVVDPQIPIYLNNSKVKYLKSEYNVKTYTIAVVSPAQLETGQHILLGAALYQQQSVNNGSSTLEKNKIDERSSTDIYFEIKIADDRNSNTDTRIAEELAKNPDILAVVGPYSTEAIEATLRTYANANPPLAVVSPTASKYGLTQEYEGKDKKYEKNVFFRTISSTEIEANAWVNLIKNQFLLKDKPNSIVALYKKNQDGKGFSQNLFNRFQELTKKDNKPNKDLHVKDDENHIFDLSTITEKDLKNLSQIKDAVIILIPNGKSGNNSVYENALNVLSKLDPKNVSRIIASNPLFTVDDVTTSDNESNGTGVKTNKLGKWADTDKLNIAVDWHYGCNSSSDSEQYLYDFIGGALDRRTAASYEAVQVLSTLFKEGITRDQIITGLKNLKSQTPVKSKLTIDQTISFEDNGDRIGATDRIIVSPVKNTVKTKDKKGIEITTEKITFKEIVGSNCPSQQSGTN